MFMENRVRPGPKADNLTANCEPIVYTISSYMAIKLSALHARRALPLEIFWYSFVLEAE
jgi:hypothetical protein